MEGEPAEAYCKFEYFMICDPDTPSDAKPSVRCMTHNYSFELSPSGDTLCPIGKIEQATDVALAKIEARIEALERRADQSMNEDD